SRRPQDGRLHVHSGDRHIDVRLSVAPTLHGERLVMRLLEKNMELLSLGQVGMMDDTEQVINEILEHPYGLFLVTGPTGSGKTTT
ncbi:ATPase, T2SS/T4P/T4SS family, partial [Streptococcus pneumoniae]|nr:ATPase, T2SS/T4P/T4SS family [Streptococcus pneumoniae]